MANINIPTKNTGDTLSASEFNEVVSAVNSKQDSIAGKGLSTNDYTNTEKQNLAQLLTRVDYLEGISGASGGIWISDEEKVIGSYSFKGEEHDIYSCTVS